MQRRTFLLGGMAAAMYATPSFSTGCRKERAHVVSRGCNPKVPDSLVGTDYRTPKLNPEICLSDEAYDLMTIAFKNKRWQRLKNYKWSYGLMYRNGRTEFYRVQVKNQRCWKRQKVHAGTRIVLWINCLDRQTYTWRRHWFVTKPVTDNGKYFFVKYHEEPAASFEDKPSKVPAVPTVRHGLSS